MKRVEVIKAGEVKTEPFVLEDFIEAKVKPVTMEKITKKRLKETAKELGLSYDDEKLIFAKKILMYYMTKQ